MLRFFLFQVRIIIQRFWCLYSSVFLPAAVCLLASVWFVYKTWTFLFRIDQFFRIDYIQLAFSPVFYILDRAYFPSSNCKQFECSMHAILLFFFLFRVNKRFMHSVTFWRFEFFMHETFPSDLNTVVAKTCARIVYL